MASSPSTTHPTHLPPNVEAAARDYSFAYTTGWRNRHPDEEVDLRTAMRAAFLAGGRYFGVVSGALTTDAVQRAVLLLHQFMVDVPGLDRSTTLETKLSLTARKITEFLTGPRRDEIDVELVSLLVKLRADILDALTSCADATSTYGSEGPEAWPNNY